VSGQFVEVGPRLTGPAGWAQRISYPLDGDVPTDETATVAGYFLHCPGQSAAWEDFSFAVVHLRPIPGQSRAPVVTRRGATHEFLLLALDNLDHTPVPTDPSTWAFLRPFNLVEQVILPSDNAARTLAAECVHRVVRGSLWAEPPLSGQVEPWRSFLRANES